MEKTREEFWNIAPEVGQFLNLLIRDRKYKKVLEIGTSNGYSGLWLAEALSHTNGKLYTIESHRKGRYKLAEKNFQKSGLKNVHLILGHAPEDLDKLIGKFDMAFFDASKRDHIDFFKCLEKRINKGGLVITDNIGSHRKELAPYVKLVKKQKNWQSVKLEIGSGLLVSFKNS